MIDLSSLWSILRSYLASHPLGGFLPGFGVVILLGFLVSLFLRWTSSDIARVFRRSYKQWLALLLFFMFCLLVDRFCSAIGIILILFLAINEQQKRLYFRPWMTRRLQEYTLICLLWGYFYPETILWSIPVLFWLASAQLMWKLKVSTFREDIGLLLWLSLWFILPGALLMAISNLEQGGLKLSLYMLSVAVSSTFGKTGIAFYDKKWPPLTIYGGFESKMRHRTRWWSGLLLHVLGAGLVLMSLNLVMTLSLHESAWLALLVGMGSSASYSLTRFYLRLTSLEDTLMRHDQPMPILEVMTPLLMTNWIAYPYFLYLT
jgi:hypothetical protein